MIKESSLTTICKLALEAYEQELDEKLYAEFLAYEPIRTMVLSAEPMSFDDYKNMRIPKQRKQASDDDLKKIAEVFGLEV